MAPRAATPPPPDPLRGAAVFGRDGGVGDRQLRRRVRAATGLSPRALRRVLALRRFLAVAQIAPPGVAIARLAYAAGFADESHLARVVRGARGGHARGPARRARWPGAAG